MQNEKFRNAIHEAMERDYRNLTKTSEKHVFSDKFEKKMHKLIQRRNKPYYRIINSSAKRAACIAAGIIIVSSATIMSVDALRNAVINFIVRTFEKFSIVQTVDDGSAPEIIEEKYEITYDLNDYTIDYHEYNETFRNTVYVNDNYVIDFSQYTKSAYDLLINTENAETTAIDINGKEAVYFYDNHNYSHIIWDIGDYIIDVSSNINKSELIKIVNSVKKIE